ncbi:MAG: hypothetical protein ACXWYS_09175 [Gaiellaceae bacterium]
MRGKGLGRLAAFAGLSGCALAGFAAVAFGLAAAPARGDVGLPLPTTTSVGITTSVPGVTVTVPTTTVRLPTTLPLPTTVPLPTTTAPLPTTVPPRTTVPPPTTAATVTVPTTPSRPPVTTLPPPVSTTTVAGGGGGGAGPPGGGSAGRGSPPGTGATGAASAGRSSQVAAAARADVLRRSSGPALEAVKAGAKADRRAQAAKALGNQNTGPQAVRTSRVALRSPGLAAFYAGLEKALARPAAPGDARIRPSCGRRSRGTGACCRAPVRSRSPWRCSRWRSCSASP